MWFYSSKPKSNILTSLLIPNLHLLPTYLHTTYTVNKKFKKKNPKKPPEVSASMCFSPRILNQHFNQSILLTWQDICKSLLLFLLVHLYLPVLKSYIQYIESETQIVYIINSNSTTLIPDIHLLVYSITYGINKARDLTGAAFLLLLNWSIKFTQSLLIPSLHGAMLPSHINSHTGPIGWHMGHWLSLINHNKRTENISTGSLVRIFTLSV